jgi:hypothetical protein
MRVKNYIHNITTRRYFNYTDILTTPIHKYLLQINESYSVPTRFNCGGGGKYS